ncbi:MAG: hypothetical protein H8D23_41235 [Candidatus Brocadiales bacterium]|nr:hypothetical protein [Candidatus Brocadiales bacterium]
MDFAPIDVEDRKTWPEDVDYEVAWYPYQLVFIVMNLRSLVDPESDERLTTDCLWFPTGGGKTEAYLGLIAFEILHSRLSGRNSRGVVVLMRYTLRLLTAQQFQRAACMITALEHIRRGEVEKFGEEPISIGLWVGSSFTPNTLSEAIENYKNLTDAGKNEKNRLMVLKCPWCGAQMGPVKNGNYIQLKGYKRFKIIGTQKNSFKYICPNNLCDFSSREGIPLMVIDELIYENPPTMIIGTVDKFATIPWKNEALKMIAPKDGSGKPSLIIQDELHLITGPLGSMVGLYETLIKELCTTEINSTKIYPKIITSTATVNNAAHQINALYNHGIDKAEYREKYIKLFPSPGLVYSDSFFGQEIDNPKKSRVYVGVHATAYSSPITTQVRLVSALTQSIKTIGVKDAKEIDPYWTLVCYFNSLRELGRSATLLGDDIRSYLLKLQQRQNIAEQKERKRYTPFRILELTSRKVDSDISKTLEELENEYEIDNERNAYDICLATNMISVGVDVSRLGTMLVVGQPKTSSEYIQATSRVGRGTPGLVVVLYNPARPRDKSHFERFKNYHEWLYGNVEPVSVTPFSLPVVDRGLHAILVGLYQYFDPKARPHTPPSGEILAKITEIITSRISGVEDGEINEYKEKIEQIINYWDREDHTTWGKMNGYIGNQADIPLLYPFGKQIPDGLEKNVFQTPTSLRSVDAECRPEILDIEYGDL